MINKIRNIIIVLAILCSGISGQNKKATVQQNSFVFAQLKYSGVWDPYPYIFQDILSLLSVTTTIKVFPERRILTLKDNIIFSTPWINMLNSGKFDKFTSEEEEILKWYAKCGGTLFIEDASAIKNSLFDTYIRQELKKIFPETKLVKLPREHPVYRAFYLIRGATGRRQLNNYLEGIDIDGRTAVIYSQNDLFGTWARDRFGNYFWECLPGGETQRFEAQKLVLNIFIYSVTGTYKTDHVHKPFIEERLKR